ncbi:hypothetical protein [Paenibacillus sp. J2TS4]|uniref:hypothetical protein n=1 Tax=Paenibacillus sp. J2TS4 TaxID=2807194 RepID=UPI001BCF6BE8|nr:hypothetical protein [Paenibacillus sp. J2TS4]
MSWPPVVLLYSVPAPPSPWSAAMALASLLYFVLYQPVFLIFLKGLGREVLGRTVAGSLTLGISHLISFFWAMLSEEHQTVQGAIAKTKVNQSSSPIRSQRSS